MKNKQKLRFLVQLLYLLITIMSAFIDLRWTMSIILVSMILGGTYYCGWACPFGTVQEMMGKLARVCRIKQRKVPKALHKYLKYSRYIILLLITLLTSNIIFTIMSLEPRNTLSSLLTGNLPTLLSDVVIGVFLLSSLFYERLYCNYLCSEGAKYGLISSIRPFTIHRNKNSCISCDKCNKVCPMNIDISKSKALRSTQCINCFKCVDTCPVEDVLTYKLIQFDKRTIGVYILLLVILIPGLMFKKSLEYTTDSQFNPTDASTITQSSVDIDVTSDDEIDNSSTIDSSTIDSSTIDSSTIDSSTIDSSTIDTIIASSNEDNDVSSTADSIIGSITSSETLYTDGIYSGVGEGFRDKIYVDVTIENDVITNVEVTQHQDDRKWYNRAYDTIRNRILDSQSTDVDLVSGATYTSEGIRDAVANALEKAK